MICGGCGRNPGKAGAPPRLEHPSIMKEDRSCTVAWRSHAGSDRPRAKGRIIQLALGQKTGVNTVVVITTGYQHLPILEHRRCVSLPALEHAAGCCPKTCSRVVQLCRGNRNTIEINRCPADGQHLAVA